MLNVWEKNFNVVLMEPWKNLQACKLKDRGIGWVGGGLEMAQQLRIALAGYGGLVPSTHTHTHGTSKLYVTPLPRDLMHTSGLRQACGAQMHIQTKYSRISNANKIKVQMSA